jgi:hypothetical protein
MRLFPGLRFFAALLVVAAASMSPASAIDGKVVGAGTACIAYGPDTTAAELQFTQTGIYNPGTTTEKVMCQLMHDLEGEYLGDPALQARVSYRVLGATPGRVTCTLFVGTTSQQTDPIYATTLSGDLQSAGGRGQLVFSLAGGMQQAGYNMVPTTMICAISPKTSMATITYYEWGSTEGPSN